MSKEIDNKECRECDSVFKLIYDLDKTSGFPKFCPFCGGEVYDEKLEVEDDEDE